MSDIRLPKLGRSWGGLREQMKQMAAQDVAWRQGRAAIYVFHPGDEVLEVAHEAYGMFIGENGLGPAAFPSLQRMEAEVVEMALGLLQAPKGAAGCMTSGGTESLLLAIKTCRDISWAKGQRQRDTLLVPATAHPAVEKAASLFLLRVRRLPVAADFRADPAAFAAAIDARTLMLLASAPCFPFGVIDPIAELSAIALQHDLWLHVDACVGAFLAPFVKMLGGTVPEFDFAAPGVRSMSGDLHKYGYAAKGASTVLYRHATDFAQQIFDADVWPSGRMRTPTLAGTRPGGAIAAAWAVLNYLGEQGYQTRARMVVEARLAIEEGVRRLGFVVHGQPQLGIVNFGLVGPVGPLDAESATSAIGEGLLERGWRSGRTSRPRGIQLMLSPFHINVLDDYLATLEKLLEEVRRGQRGVSDQSIIYANMSPETAAVSVDRHQT